MRRRVTVFYRSTGVTHYAHAVPANINIMLCFSAARFLIAFESVELGKLFLVHGDVRVAQELYISAVEL